MAERSAPSSRRDNHRHRNSFLDSPCQSDAVAAPAKSPAFSVADGAESVEGGVGWAGVSA